MSPVVLSLLLDGMMAVLLVATISYCSRLSSRIRLLQDSRGELSEMINKFDQATGRASASLAELQTVSKKIADALQLKIEKANFLADDLVFLIEKSTKIAAQLEQAKKQPPVAEEKPRPTVLPRPLFETVPVKPKSAIMNPISATKAAPSKVTASLEAVLQRLASNSVSEEISDSATPPRTSAERELMQALKTGR